MSSLDQRFNESTTCFGFNLQPPNNQHQHRLPSAISELQNPEIDNMLSEAMNKLTFEERQEQQEVLHGVNEQLKEEEPIIERSLSDMDRFLSTTKSGSYYEMAEKMNPDYVHDRAFRIMFLRGNRYDAKASATMMLRFFEQKHKLFGKDKLVKDITIEDLDQDDLESLRSGATQILGRDASNRHVLTMIPSLRNAKTSLNELRSIYYIFMTVLKSQETQLRGHISIQYTVGIHKDSMKGAGYVDIVRLAMSLPLYMAACHLCGDKNTAESVLWNVAIKMFPAKRRARIQLHFGSHMECIYKLSTYGIPSQILPFYPGSNVVNLENHHRWCNSRLAMDTAILPTTTSSSPAAMLPIEPNANDVLYVGKKKNTNYGNQRLRALVREHSPMYDAGSNEKKRQVVEVLLEKVREWGGRFLKQDDNEEETVWEELNAEEARAKVGQLFRNNRRRPDASRDKVHGGFIISDMARPNDVVFGKGARSQGSELLHHLIKNHSDEYDSLDRGKKKDLVDSILQQIKGQGGRFLQPTEGIGKFLEVTDDMARARISKYFRNNRRSKPASQATVAK